MITIESVKQLSDSNYLLNNSVFVPADERNPMFRAILQWINDGGIVEPKFSDDEIANNLVLETNQSARVELKNSDWLVIRELERLFLKDTDLNLLREQLRSKVQE